MTAASARQVMMFGGDSGSGVGGVGSGGGGDGDDGGFNDDGGFKLGYDVNYVNNLPWNERRETLKALEAMKELPCDERRKFLGAVFVEAMEKVWNERRKILEALFMEAIKIPPNESREILKNLFVGAMDKLPWDERREMLDQLEAKIKKAAGLDLESVKTQGEEERAADIIKRQEERAAAREALEMLERNADVEDDFKVTRELEELLGGGPAWADLGSHLVEELGEDEEEEAPSKVRKVETMTIDNQEQRMLRRRKMAVTMLRRKKMDAMDAMWRQMSLTGSAMS